MDVNASHRDVLDTLRPICRFLAALGRRLSCDPYHLNLLNCHALLLKFRSKRGTWFRTSDGDAELHDGVSGRKLKPMSRLEITVDTKAELHLARVRIAVDEQLRRHVQVQVLGRDLPDAQHFNLPCAILA